jgi:hypothetical protein
LVSAVLSVFSVGADQEIVAVPVVAVLEELLPLEVELLDDVATEDVVLEAVLEVVPAGEATTDELAPVKGAGPVTGAATAFAVVLVAGAVLAAGAGDELATAGGAISMAVAP